MRLGAFSFLLQDHYVQQWADNLVVHLLVTDVRRWWDHIVALDLAALRRQNGGASAGELGSSPVSRIRRACCGGSSKESLQRVGEVDSPFSLRRKRAAASR